MQILEYCSLVFAFYCLFAIMATLFCSRRKACGQQWPPGWGLIPCCVCFKGFVNFVVNVDFDGLIYDSSLRCTNIKCAKYFPEGVTVHSCPVCKVGKVSFQKDTPLNVKPLALLKCTHVICGASFKGGLNRFQCLECNKKYCVSFSKTVDIDGDLFDAWVHCNTPSCEKVWRRGLTNVLCSICHQGRLILQVFRNFKEKKASATLSCNRNCGVDFEAKTKIIPCNECNDGGDVCFIKIVDIDDNYFDSQVICRDCGKEWQPGVLEDLACPDCTNGKLCFEKHNHQYLKNYATATLQCTQSRRCGQSWSGDVDSVDCPECLEVPIKFNKIINHEKNFFNATLTCSSRKCGKE
eukprot:Awhi_evm1s7075